MERLRLFTLLPWRCWIHSEESSRPPPGSVSLVDEAGQASKQPLRSSAGKAAETPCGHPAWARDWEHKVQRRMRPSLWSGVWLAVRMSRRTGWTSDSTHGYVESSPGWVLNVLWDSCSKQQDCQRNWLGFAVPFAKLPIRWLGHQSWQFSSLYSLSTEPLLMLCCGEYRDAKDSRNQWGRAGGWVVGGRVEGNTKNTGLLFPSRIVSYTAENHPATKRDSETVAKI